MLLLSFIWGVMGLVVGALGCGARLRFVLWGKRGWLVVLCTGVVSALVGGWLGAWLFGPQFATVAALWVGVVSVGLLPWIFTRKTNDARPGSDESYQSNPVMDAPPS